jgi:hypothetical protein
MSYVAVIQKVTSATHHDDNSTPIDQQSSRMHAADSSPARQELGHSHGRLEQ